MFNKIQFEVKAIRGGRAATATTPATVILEVSVDSEVTLANPSPGPRVSIEVEDTPEVRASYGQKWESDTWTEAAE